MNQHRYLGTPPGMSDQDTTWLIDIGPFFDRFGASKIPILASANPLVRAVVIDVTARKWVDLKRPDVDEAIDLIISQGVGSITPELKDAILNAPVDAEEQRALIKLYFT